VAHFNDGCLSVDTPVGNHFCRVMTAQGANLQTAIQATAAGAKKGGKRGGNKKCPLSSLWRRDASARKVLWGNRLGQISAIAYACLFSS